MTIKTKAKTSPFCAYLFRLKHIQRWSLMRNNDSENVMEHSWMVAVVAHELALIHNSTTDGSHVDPQSLTCKALFHDATEALTGDLPTPIKYHSDEIKQAYGEVERIAAQRLLQTIPASRRPYYERLLDKPEQQLERQLLKASDKICAWIKCVEERRMGNAEFEQAEKAIRSEIERHEITCVMEWFDTYGKSFENSLDELSQLEQDASF
jgi:5'-deoxynucleotidase